MLIAALKSCFIPSLLVYTVHKLISTFVSPYYLLSTIFHILYTSNRPSFFVLILGFDTCSILSLRLLPLLRVEYK